MARQIKQPLMIPCVVTLLIALVSWLVLGSDKALQDGSTYADWLPEPHPQGQPDPVSRPPTAGSPNDFPSAPPVGSQLMLYGQPVERSYPGKIIRIVDGDTVELLLEDMTHPNFRLASIDAPERGQAFGEKAREILKPYIGQIATIHQTDTDRWQRPIAFIELSDGLNVNAAMLDAGMAWHYHEYSQSAELDQLERNARVTGRGLWADVHAMAPWDWRRQQREAKQK